MLFPTKKEERQYERRAELSRNAAKAAKASAKLAEAVRTDGEREAMLRAQHSQPQPLQQVNAHNSPLASTATGTSAAQLEAQSQAETRAHTTARQHIGGAGVQQNERRGETLWGAGEEVEVLAFARDPSGVKRPGTAHVRMLQPDQKRARQHRQM